MPNVRRFGPVSMIQAITISLGQQPRHTAAIFSSEALEGAANLLEIVQALDPLGLSLRLGQGGQKHAGQDADDGNNNQKFDKCESILNLFKFFHIYSVNWGFLFFQVLCTPTATGAHLSCFGYPLWNNEPRNGFKRRIAAVGLGGR